MADPIALRAVQAAIVALQGVTVALGYHTDAGQRVHHARRSFGVEDADAFSVFEGAEVASNSSAAEGNDGAAGADGSTDAMLTQLELKILAVARADQDDAGERLALLKADAKRALCTASREGFGDETGKIGPLVYVGSELEPREDGDNIESVGLTFRVTYTERFGDPSART